MVVYWLFRLTILVMRPFPLKIGYAIASFMASLFYYPFRRQRGAEYVADESRVAGPVHAELELQRDPGGHSDGEGEGKDLDPEARHPAVGFIAAAEISCLHQDDEPRHTYGDGREYVMETRRQSELQPREEHRIQVHRQPPA